MPCRLMVGHQPLELSIVVRIHAGQQIDFMKIKYIVNGWLIVSYTYAFLIADKTKLFLHYHYSWVPGDFMTDSRYPMFALVVAAILGIVIYFLGKFKKSSSVDFKIKDASLGVMAAGILMVISKPAINWSWILWSLAMLTVGVFLVIESVNIFLKTKKSFRKFLPFILVSTPFLILAHSLEMIDKTRFEKEIYFGVVLSFLVNLLGNWFVNLVYKRKKINTDDKDIFKVTLAGAYVFMPLVHFLLMTPRGIKYITSWDNFFSGNLFFQLAIFLAHFLIIKMTNQGLRQTNRKVG
jgi:hypothetical protein